MSKQSPYFLLHREKLLKNLKLLQELESRADITILHTLKSFSEATILPTISSKISGFSVSSKGELQLAKEANAKRVHIYSPAFNSELIELVKDVDTISFNSLTQWDKFLNIKSCKGLRLNPMLDLNNPNYCNFNNQNSHLGVDYRLFLQNYAESKKRFKDLEGLHFHILFKSNANGVEKLFKHITSNYREILPNIKWLNLGGGHNITSPNYNKKLFLKEVANFKEQYPNIELIFEPGEGVLHNCGEFICKILDISENGVILNTSIETHLLDIAITKLKPKIKNAVANGKYSYKLCGNSCQNGDVIGRYSFDTPLKIGDELIFEDMLSYTLVKTTTFGGVEKPKLYVE